MSKLARAKARFFLGVDVGNGYTNARDLKFKSKVKEVNHIMYNERLSSRLAKEELKDTHCVSMNGKYYIVGEGSDFTDIYNRYFSEEYKLCLLTAIVETYPTQDHITTTACVGLPSKMYLTADESLRLKLQDTFSKKTFNLVVNDREVTVNITEFAVYVEGAYPNYIDDNREVIVVDMGMGTTNLLSFVNGEVVDRDTVPFGMKGLCNELVDIINDEKVGRNVLWEEIDACFGDTKFQIGREESTYDLTKLDHKVVSYLKRNIDNVKDRFNVVNAKAVYIMGGGGQKTYAHWEDVIVKPTLVPDAQIINSKIYDMVAQYCLEGE